MISVVLCCYNGEKYIREQLNSIFNQSKRVDEVIIYDDGSSDNTIAICEEFINKYNLNYWKVVKNNINCGVYQNFMNGCQQAKGDVIFLADQDDIWHYNKVEVMTKYFELNNNILSLTTGFKNIDSKGKVISEKVKHPYSKINELRKIKFEEYLKFYNYLGMTMAIRKNIIEDVVKLTVYGDYERKQKHLTHDIAINFYAVLHNGLYFLDKELVTRRTHLESTSNINNPKAKLNIIDEEVPLDPVLINIKMYASTMEWFFKLIDVNLKKEKNTIIKFKEFYECRYNALVNKNIKELSKLSKYITCYKTPLHYINDFVYLFKKINIMIG